MAQFIKSIKERNQDKKDNEDDREQYLINAKLK